MRKSIAVLFISFIMICLISIGLSETNYAVNFLGNVTFGMSANEVRFNLQQSNFSVNDSNWGTTVFGEIGGFEKSAATFNYNVLEQLDSVKYDLKINSDEETTAHDFDIVEETLIKKYGDTSYCTQTGNTYKLNNRTTNPEWYYRTFGGPKRNGWEKNTPGLYSERVVEYGDGTYMLIEHYLYNNQFDFYDQPELQHLLAYTHYYDDLSKTGAERNSDNQLTQEQKMTNAF